jgi:translation elongation factor EF-1alpha
MDDIEIGINVFVASARHHCFQLQLQVERQKNKCWALLHTMSTPQLQALLNKHDNNHCPMLSKHWYAWF